jgi:cyanophycinase
VIGGGERTPAVLDTFVALAGRGAAHIVVVPWASAEPDNAGAILARELRAAGAGSVAIATASNKPRALTELRRATGVLLAGGDQARLMDSLRSTVYLAELRRRHADGIVLGGTSAGAAVMSTVMITGDELDDDGATPGLRSGRERSTRTPGWGSSTLRSSISISRRGAGTTGC